MPPPALIVHILAPASMLPAPVARSAASRDIVDGVTERTVLLTIVFVLCLLANVVGKAAIGTWRDVVSLRDRIVAQ